jgi:hypothetical protein
MDMRFPQELLHFLYMIFFKPISLHAQINQLDPGIGNVATLLTRSYDRSAQPLKNLALFYILIMPWLLGFGTGMLLSQLGLEVNWLKLAFYLLVGITLSLTFSIHFCIAFLLPFSVVVAFWSGNAFAPEVGIFFSLMLGLTYGLNGGSAKWGLTAGLVYGFAFGLILNPLNGLYVGAAFLIGYFRIIFYLFEALWSWSLAKRSESENARSLWRLNPVVWDELIWLPLPGLDRHLQALKRQNESAGQVAILQVQESFRQGWASERIQKEG